MRVLMPVMAMLVVGCASQPTNSHSDPGPGKLAITEAQRLAIAKNLNLKVVDQDGQQVFCRSNFQTATRIRRDTTCYTADQLEQLEVQQQRDFDQMALRSSMGGIRTSP
jgi:hypothetical protein